MNIRKQKYVRTDHKASSLKECRTLQYLDGRQFKESIIASALRISEMEHYLNKINVYPVPDGDTGTNMAATMDSIVEGARRCDRGSFGEISGVIADSAFMGAQGNSGVILAQFFQGLAESTKGKIQLSTRTFAAAAIDAVNQARRSISAPREGTIITVMKDWADYLSECAHQTQDFVELMRESLKRAKDSLADTPNLLVELKKAGVVDAGGQGFVSLLEGMVDFIESGRVKAFKIGTQVARKVREAASGSVHADITFRYCTQCLIEGDALNHDEVRRAIEDMGNSLIVVGSKSKVRIHIHTNEPDRVFAAVASYGAVSKKNVDDMQAQHETVVASTSAKVALVTDSTCDLPPEMFQACDIHVVPLTLQIGKNSYLDRVEIGTTEFYAALKSTKEKLSTSQPSPRQFIQVYEKLAPVYESIVSIHISEKLSGTIGGARSASRVNGLQDKVHVIDSKTSSAAMGLIAHEACRLIKSGLDVKEIVRRIEGLVNNTKIFINLPTLKYAMRSGRVTKTKGIIGTLLNIRPVLTVDAEGRVVEIKKVLGRRKVIRRTLELAVQYARTCCNPRFSVVHVLEPRLAAWYKNELKSMFMTEDILVMDASPVLGLHVGIGSTAIAVLGR